MRELGYLKQKCKQIVSGTFDEDFLVTPVSNKRVNKKNLYVSLSSLVLLITAGVYCFFNIGIDQAMFEESSTIQLMVAPEAVTASAKSTISIPSGIVKQNPFLPYRDLSGKGKVDDVPSYNLVEPPEAVAESSEAARIMDTIVSGILYDKHSPSAILNIEGNDYLVKKGDVVNNYQILGITQDSVSVKLGENTYKAGIGEILTEGTLTHNNVSNLRNKFGGTNDES